MRSRQIPFLAALLLFTALPPANAAREYYKTNVETIPIRIGDEPTIQATLQIPGGCSAGTKFPVVILFGGFQEAADVLKMIHPKENYILASFDYPYSGSRRFRFPRTLIDSVELRNSVKNTQLAISRLVLLLKARADIDSDQIAIVGASFGAPFAIRAAADNKEVDALIVVHGFGDIEGLIRYRLTQRWSERFGRFTKWFATPAAWIITKFLDPPTPEEDAKKLWSTQIALMVEATGDTLIPQPSRDVLWAGFSVSPARTKRIQMPGDHLRPGSDDLIEKIMDVAESWLKKMGWFKGVRSCSP